MWSDRIRWSSLLWAVIWLACVIVAVLVVWGPKPAHAADEVYTPTDTLNAIHEASVEIGVDEGYLTRIVRCETGGSFSPYSIGRQGELGAAQLHPRGLLPTFYSWGYLDPFSPYQSVRFLAQEVSFGRARLWSCAR